MSKFLPSRISIICMSPPTAAKCAAFQPCTVSLNRRRSLYLSSSNNHLQRNRCLFLQARCNTDRPSYVVSSIFILSSISKCVFTSFTALINALTISTEPPTAAQCNKVKPFSSHVVRIFRRLTPYSLFCFFIILCSNKYMKYLKTPFRQCLLSSNER